MTEYLLAGILAVLVLRELPGVMRWVRGYAGYLRKRWRLRKRG